LEPHIKKQKIFNPRYIERIKIDGVDVWTGHAVMGSELDITDVNLQYSDGLVPINVLEFDNNMEGGVFRLYFLMSDGSLNETENFQE